MSEIVASYPVSPLDPASPVRIEWSLSRQEIAARWRRAHGVEVGRDFLDGEQVDFCRCQHTQLGFFHPTLAGQANFYAQLERHDWYYRAGKWEHAFACAQLAPGARVLDVGCGRGEFLAAAAAAGYYPEGIDFNAGAVAAARARGLAASMASLNEKAEQGTSYDAVTVLQVLEHIPDAAGFLRDCLRLLRPGGRLIVAVPDSEGWLNRAGSILELPPHHATHWNAAAMQSLTKLFPVKLCLLQIEPLDPQHSRDFAAAIVRPAAPDGIRQGGLARRVLSRMLAAAVRSPAVSARLPGATLAAVFCKQ